VRSKDLRDEWLHGDAVAIGRELWCHLSPAAQVARAIALLQLCCAQRPRVPEVEAVIAIAGEPKRWSEAHQAFQAVRSLVLREEASPSDRIYYLLLFLTENTAKTVYLQCLPFAGSV
jgi:hypothetical protein